MRSRLSFGVGSLSPEPSTALSSAPADVRLAKVLSLSVEKTAVSMAKSRFFASWIISRVSALWWQEKQARFATKAAADFWIGGRARLTALRTAISDCGRADIAARKNRIRIRIPALFSIVRRLFYVTHAQIDPPE